MQQEFITKLGKARAELTAAQERDLVLRLAKNDVVTHLDGYVTAHRQQIIAALENWWDKYAVPLHQIEASAKRATRLGCLELRCSLHGSSSRTLAMSDDSAASEDVVGVSFGWNSHHENVSSSY